MNSAGPFSFLCVRNWAIKKKKCSSVLLGKYSKEESKSVVCLTVPVPLYIERLDSALTHYCLTATIVTVLSKFSFKKKKGSWKNYL